MGVDAAVIKAGVNVKVVFSGDITLKPPFVDGVITFTDDVFPAILVVFDMTDISFFSAKSCCGFESCCCCCCPLRKICSTTVSLLLPTIVVFLFADNGTDNLVIMVEGEDGN